MPPKNMPLPAQQPSVQDTLGINLEYMLPHQRDQYRKHLANMNDLRSRKAKEPNNPQLEAAIREARNQLNQLAAAAAQNEKQYPTPELFAQYVNQYHQTIQQRRAEITGASNSTGLPPNEQARALQVQAQLTSQLKELDGKMQNPDITDDEKNLLRNDYSRKLQQYQALKTLVENNQAQARMAAAVAPSSQPDNTAAQPPTPPVSQTQPATPTIRNAPPSQQIQMQQSASLPPTVSMGPLPRPSVNNPVPPARPTLTGGYPVGNPLLGTTSPAGIPHAFQIAQDGDARLLSKRKLQDLVKSIDPDERLEPDVEELLMEVADEFIDSVLQQSCKITRHRKGQMLEVKDVQLHLERNWNIRIPGYSSEEVRSVKKYNPTPAHAAKVGAVNQAKAMTKD